MKLSAVLLLSACVVAASIVPVASADLPAWLAGKPTWLFVTDYQCSVFNGLPKSAATDPQQMVDHAGQAGFLFGYAVATLAYFTPGPLGSTMTLQRFTQAMFAKCQENPNLTLVDVTRSLMSGAPMP